MHVAAAGDETASKGRNDGRVLIDAAAGAVAGCVSRFVVGPLDVIKIRFQVQLEPIAGTSASHYKSFGNAFKTILRDEGIPGLWRGTVPGLLLTVPYTAVQFVALEQCKATAASWGFTGPSPWVSFTSGAVAGAAATMASYPFDLLRTTLAAQGEPKVYRGMLDATRGICQQHGVRGLYRGLGVTLVEIVPYASLQFGLYDVFNRMWAGTQFAGVTKQHSSSSSGTKRSGGNTSNGGGARVKPTQVQSFTCGLLAGLIAKLVSHPLDVAKKRYQVAGLPRSLKYGARIDQRLAVKPLFACLAEIYSAEGIRGLWKGSIPSIVKAAPAAAVTFTAYEVLLSWMLAAQQQQRQQQQQQSAKR